MHLVWSQLRTVCEQFERLFSAPSLNPHPRGLLMFVLRQNKLLQDFCITQLKIAVLQEKYQLKERVSYFILLFDVITFQTKNIHQKHMNWKLVAVMFPLNILGSVRPRWKNLTFKPANLCIYMCNSGIFNHKNASYRNVYRNWCSR